MFTKSGLAFSAVAVLVGIPAASGQGLPEGKGKEIVAAKCNSCHTFESRVGIGYTPEGWSTVMRMMANHGVTLTKEETATLMPYLTQHFAQKARPAAVIVEGPLKVTMKSWPVPTPGSRPHDPLATRDGMLWYTGQMTNALGRLDPKTGAWKEFKLKTAHSAPHGLVEDKAGNIWYTGNAAGLIGKLDPKTGAVTEYKMPDPNVRDPHTLIVDKSGIVWFTAQNANRIGRLDPASGDVKLLTPPTPKSRPYGMAVNSKGTVYAVQFGVNKVAAVDPKTLAIREYALPDAGARPRRIAITSDDMVWYTDFSRGYIGKLDPATGQVTEWQSPSGPKSQPYGISAIKDVIWYSESGANPNTVVRFDPKTAKFQSWAIPGGGDIVRNTDVTADGNFVLANSLANQVTLVSIPK